MFIDLQQMANELSMLKSVDILCHRSPDGDTVGSAVALFHAFSAMKIPSRVVCSDPFPNYLPFLIPTEFMLVGKGETVVAVDTATRGLLGGLSDEYPIVHYNIDHHPTNEDFAEKTCLVADAAAAAQVVAKVIREMGVSYTPPMATALYTALSSDSGSFRYSGTSPETLRLAAELIEAGADFTMINEALFESKSRSLVKAEAMAMDGIYYEGPIALMPVTREIFNRSGASSQEMESLASIPRNIMGVKIAIMVKENPEELKVSFRTTAPYDASVIASAFGGGGHIRAAGCRMKGISLEDGIQLLLAEARKQL